MESTPHRDVSMHMLYSDSALEGVIQRIRHLLPADFRMRVRLHLGSTLEAEYSLRTFGIDVSDQLSAPEDAKCEGIDESIRKRQHLDEEWRQSEAPYRDPASLIALYPNPQDIIMGRNQAVTVKWPGNVLYRKVIHQFADRYVELQSIASDRIERTAISLEILHLLRGQYNARFLSRNDDSWTVINDWEAQKKISHSLRSSARQITVTYSITQTYTRSYLPYISDVPTDSDNEHNEMLDGPCHLSHNGI